MEEIKIKVKSKQLDGSTEVADTTMNASNQFTSENSVIPPSGGGGGGSSFLGTLTEDNLLFEFLTSGGDTFVNHAPADLDGNHLVIITCEGSPANTGELKKSTIGWLHTYDSSNNIINIGCNLTLYFNDDQSSIDFNIYELRYDGTEDTPDLKFAGNDRDTFDSSSSPMGYNNDLWHDFKVYLLK